MFSLKWCRVFEHKIKSLAYVLLAYYENEAINNHYSNVFLSRALQYEA